MDIDYVITWVDGDDPQHKAGRRQFSPVTRASASSREETEKNGAYEQRYSSDGEIYYNIASVLKYAPFIRRIFIVTDNQKPALLDSFVAEGKCRADFLQLVSHDEIFAGLEAARPTFNSRSIETALWRIPELCEHFIYSNDDFFINAPLKREDFFQDGLPVLRGNWKKAENRRLKYRLRHLLGAYRDRPTYAMGLWKGAVFAGIDDKYLAFHHHAHALRKSTFEQFFARNPDLLKQQLSFRFRDKTQFNPISLANHLEIVQNGVVPVASPDLAYLGDIVREAQLEKIRRGVVPFGCIQGMGGYKAAARMKLHRIMMDKFAGTLPEAVKQMLIKELAVS